MFQDLDNPSKHSTATLLVDGDIVAYQAAAAADGRKYKVPKGSGELITGYEEFKYKKDAVAYADANGIDTIDIQLCFEPEPISHALHNIKLNLDTIQRVAPEGEMIIYLTGNNNYRKQIDPSYKAHRKALRVPEHLAECKQYLMNKHGATLEEGLEADDLLGVMQVALTEDKVESIIASLDKDLKCIPGLHYDWRKDLLTEIDPFRANQFFYEQVLMGDSTDNIKGLKGIGPKKAAAWMSEIDSDPTDYQWYEHAIELYFSKMPQEKEETPDQWIARVEGAFSVTARLVWIQRKKYETWVKPEEPT